MGRLWQLNGPDEDVLTLAQVARLFGYEVKSLRKLIKEGRFPPPRGIWPKEYYTGEDVAAARHYFGRWQPEAEPGPKKKDAESDEEEI
jgi:hypothetical protein